MKIIFVVLTLALAAYLGSQPAPKEQVGPLGDGAFLLNSGWKVQPAGEQIPLDTFPMSSTVSKDGKYLLVLNGGYKPPSIIVLNIETMQKVSRVPVADGWLGLTFSPDGKTVYAGGGAEASVFEFSFSEGKLEAARTFVVVPKEKQTHRDFIGDVIFDPAGRLLYAAGLYHDAIHVINPQSGRVIETIKTGRRPYRLLFHPDGKSFFVSSWADGTIYHHAAETGARLGFVRVAPHTTDMVWRLTKPEEKEGVEQPVHARIFVTASNTNSVYAVGVTESKDLRMMEGINVAMTPRQPVGMTPSALELNETEDKLFVVCSDANAVAVVDISGERSGVSGFIPVGWYPTAVRSLADGRLVVLNGRGMRSYPNPRGPNPTVRAAPVHLGNQAVEYVGRIQTGTASVVEPFGEKQLDEYSKTVLKNSPYNDNKLDFVDTGTDNPVPSRPGDPSPIQHVIYIVKENRTYDQVLGDLKQGNGDPSLTLFGEKVTPNHHKLAREFVLFDNFYVNADVSADGHNWSTSAIANDYVQKMWPNSYGGRRKHYDYEGGEVAALPPAGYIWTNAASAGISMRNYGWWVTNREKPADQGEPQIQTVRDSVLAKVTSMNYRGYDLNYPDVERAKTFISELAEFEKSGSMPKLIFLRIGNDHTYGAAAGRLSPHSLVADNDYALGMIVEAVSKSRFWPQTAIFVLEDDAQNGPDHVDSHRSPAYVISPYTRRGIVDSNMYNTVSMLRTIELIAGLRPMTHFDAGARPMSAAFSSTADNTPYTAEKPRVPLDERNPKDTQEAARTARLDFSEADRIDDNELNAILWRAIKKTDPPVP
ncbi:MAG: alkaline phosphatase family protein, partial [Bryobacteraceae bacterium]